MSEDALYGRLPLLRGEREYTTRSILATGFAVSVAAWCFLIGGYAANVVGALQGNYGDRSKEFTPAYSVLASDSISSSVGRFGLLLDYSRSHVITRTQNVIMDKIDTYCSAGYGTSEHAIVNADGSIPCTSNPFGGTGWACAPDGIRYSQVDYDRDRIGSTVAAQYQNNAKSFLATVQYTGSSYRNQWLEDASHAMLDGTYFGSPAFNPRSTDSSRSSLPSCRTSISVSRMIRNRCALTTSTPGNKSSRLMRMTSSRNAKPG